MKVSPARVVIDVDVGADDYLALLILFYYQSLGLVIIEAIICSAGNTARSYSCGNVARLLQTVGKTNIPVYPGAAEGLIPPPPESPADRFFGVDGLGDQQYGSSPNWTVIRSEPGVEALGRLILKNPGKITLLCVAPLTTESLAFKVYDNFNDSIKDLWIMGGDYTGEGNAKAAPAIEFNFYTDPEAARITLDSYRKRIHFVTWETCLNSPISIQWFKKVFAPRTNKNPAIAVMNRAVIKTYDSHNLTDYAPADAYLVGAFLDRALIEYSTSYVDATVELCGSYTRGLLVLNYTDSPVKRITVIDEIDVERFKMLLLKL